MLRREPDERISLSDIVNHPWMSKDGTRCCDNSLCVALVGKEHLAPEEQENIIQRMVEGGIATRTEILRYTSVYNSTAFLCFCVSVVAWTQSSNASPWLLWILFSNIFTWRPCNGLQMSVPHISVYFMVELWNQMNTQMSRPHSTFLLNDGWSVNTSLTWNHQQQSPEIDHPPLCNGRRG